MIVPDLRIDMDVLQISGIVSGPACIRIVTTRDMVTLA